MEVEERLAVFEAWAGTGQPVTGTVAPGRVNLIGEHTDYNDGFVLPVAIDRRSEVLAGRRTDHVIRLYSHAVGEEASFSLDHLTPESSGSWPAYVMGLAAGLSRRGVELPGLDLMIWSDVPLGSGLSSSAAYEMAVLRAFELHAGIDLPAAVAVDVAQGAEWEFAGSRTGIMDQTVSRSAREEHALFLDCRSRETRQIPIRVAAEIVVCHTGVSRSLAQSAYNERRAQCEEAVEALRGSLSQIEALRDVTPEEWDRLADTVPEPARRRARHVITEDARVPEAARALERGDLVRLAELFAASHRSLRDDYEVSSPELDALVEIAAEVDPSIPSRLTGAGFGGCTVHLVPPEMVERFQRRIGEEYPQRTGYQPTIYRCRSVGGASGGWVRQ